MQVGQPSRLAKINYAGLRICQKITTGETPVLSTKNPIDKFTLTRRHLPHWQAPCSVYFVTTRCIEGKTLSGIEKDIVENTIRYLNGRRYNLFAYVIMPDHFHLIIQPLEVGRTRVSLVDDQEKYYNLSEIMHSIKSFSAHEINKKIRIIGSTFQHENFDRIIRNEDELYEKMNYIINNPVKAGLIENPNDYKWLFYIGG
mgnify:CR=1 FL=1